MAHDVNQSDKEFAAQLRSSLVDRISQERVDLWIPQDTLWEWQDHCLRLSFQSLFACNLARRMLIRELASTLCELVGPDARLIMEQSKSLNSVTTASLHATAADPRPRPHAQPDFPATISIASPSFKNHLPPRTTVAEKVNPVSAAATIQTPKATSEPLVTRPLANVWEQFVSGSCNELAWTAANIAVREPGSMSPLLFHGPSGVGKSHLAVGITQQLRSKHQLRRVMHMSSEQFTNDFTEAILGKGLPLFRRKYRDLEAFVLDDIQFLMGKKATLGELHHTIDNLLKAGRQIVLLADRSLPELEGMGAELLARIRGGLVSPLMPLDEETRYQLLSKEIQQKEVLIPDEFLRQIASRVSGDGRAIKGVVKRLVAMVSLHRSRLSWDQCWNAIFDLVQATQPVVRLKDIERVVCDVFGLEPQSLRSHCKTRTVSQPRMLAMFLARKYTPAAYKEIGDFFGHRRHSTVISAEKTVEGWLKENSELHFSRGPLNIRDAIRHVEANLHVG